MDVAFKLADVADIDLLIEFMREFYELDNLALDEQVARTALQQILSNDSFGKVWLIQVDGEPIGDIVLTLRVSVWNFAGATLSLTKSISGAASGARRRKESHRVCRRRLSLAWSASTTS